MEHKKSRVVKWSLILGIVIVLNLFFNYTLSLVFNAPDYNNFCTLSTFTYNAPQTNDDQAQIACNNNFQAAQNVYERNVFVSLVALGVIVIVASVFIKGVEVLSLSLSLSGVLTFIIASMRYWSSADNGIKVCILGAALIGLIWLAVKKFKD